MVVVIGWAIVGLHDVQDNPVLGAQSYFDWNAAPTAVKVAFFPIQIIDEATSIIGFGSSTIFNVSTTPLQVNSWCVYFGWIINWIFLVVDVSGCDAVNEGIILSPDKLGSPKLVELVNQG